MYRQVYGRTERAMGLESIFKLSVILNLIDNLTSPAQNAFGGVMKTGAMLTGAGAQLARALTAPVTASFDTKNAIAELSSLGVTELELLEDAAQKFSDTWAGTTKADFISAAYDIKSGIASLTDEGVAITSLITAMQPMIASVWSFTTALLANPATWIVIGIVALVAAIVLLYNKCEWFRNIVDSIFAAIKEKFGAALEIARNVFEGIAGVMGSVTGVAKDTVVEKLSSMKQAYGEHGGGIKGIAAAAVEGVKGFYTAGFTFLDDLTGGKLTEIKNKWSEKLAPVKEITDNIMGRQKTQSWKSCPT